MTQADRVHSTPPTNTSAKHSRRSILGAIAAGSAAAAIAAKRAVAVAAAGSSVDPIYEVIERHRKAALDHGEAVRIEFAFEAAHDVWGEGAGRQEYQRLYDATGASYAVMAEAACSLVNTIPATLAGILALCRYIEPLFAEGDDCTELPETIEYGDDTPAYPAEAFAYVIGKAIGKLIAAGA
jgi:hypothetical protein